jgi:hypothetical protein
MSVVKIFLSYCRDDENFARQLAYNLRRLGASVWIDVEAIRAGSKWSREVQQGLDMCEVMLVVVSPESMASDNVEDEWQYYREKDKPIVPILYKPADNVHFQLKRYQYVDFSTGDYKSALLRLDVELRKLGYSLEFPDSVAEHTQPMLPQTHEIRVIRCPNCKTDNYGPKIGAPCKVCGTPLLLAADQKTPKKSTQELRQLRVHEESCKLLLSFQMEQEKLGEMEVLLQRNREIKFGRAGGETPPEIDLIPFGAEDAGVSRMHASMLFDGRHVLLRDMGSTNGTYLNGDPLRQGISMEISHEDNVRLGALLMVVKIP